MISSYFGASPLTLLLLIPATVVSALSSSNIQSVFGENATGLTGSSIKLSRFEFSVVLNDTFALFCLNATTSKPSQVGWMSVGIGSAMANAEYLMTWPNFATNAAVTTPWTLSHRSPQGHSEPTIASTSSSSSTSALFTYIPELSTSDPTSPYTVVAYLRPLSFASALSATSFKPLQRSSTTFIYASSSRGPGSTAESASVSVHDQARASTTLDLSTPISLTSTSSTSSTSAAGTSSNGSFSNGSSGTVSSSSTPFASTATLMTRRDIYLIAHAVLGSIAFLLFTPIAILVGRYLRRLSSWFNIHASVQLLGSLMVVASCGLGWGFNTGEHANDAHKRVGAVLFVLVAAQVTLGYFSHRISAPRREDVRHARLPTLYRKSPVRLIHIFLGVFITLLGFAQIRLGLSEFTLTSDGQYAIPTWAIGVFWGIVIAVILLYAVGWWVEARGRRQTSSLYDNTGIEKLGSNDMNLNELQYRGQR